MVKSAAPTFKYRWVILMICWFAYMTAFMQRLSIGPLAPFLKEDLGLTSAQVGWFMSAAAFGYMLSLIPAGWLVDRIGVRWLLLAGEVIGGAFLASMFFIHTYSQGLLLMALAGIGMGCIMPSTTKATLEWFTLKERATAMGFKQTAVNVGGIITASTLPAVALALSWHYGFAGIGLLAVVIGIISFILYKHPPQSASPDATEVVTTSGPKPSPLEIFRNRDIWLVTGAGFCLVVVEFSVIAYFVLYVEETLLLTIVNAGFFLAILESGGAFGKPISGLISDRLFHGNRKRVYILMCSLTFATCLIFTFLQQGAPSWIMIPLCFILGFVGIGWGGLHLTLVGEFAGKELAGTVTGASSVFLMVGNIIGPPTFGYIVDTTGSYRIAWMFLTIMAILAVVFLLFVREANRRI
jgi:ACS family hexuronate transporter-like MFS transporter